ncbi:MAG: 8-amino-7-oxononanoate synthase [Muribaculaceae bacterium]|nr:8-amino-7-oxononanoate synthase [Muribaculaceae bacterium]
MIPASLQKYSEILTQYAGEGRLRTIPDCDKKLRFDLTSNDYMGLAHNAGLYRDEFYAKYGNAPFTSSASRLLAGTSDYYSKFEEYLESLYGKPALIFNSGYHANVGIIQALNVPGTYWVVDKLAHASVIDGLKLANANFKRFPHNDITKLRNILSKEANKYQRVILVIEGIYSMDGDTAPLEKLVELKREYPNLLIYLDEAHSFGVLGTRGLGLAERLGLIDEIDILLVTLGKAAASSGAFAVTNSLIKQFLINNARSLIFSTALPPISVAWSMFMIEKLTEMQSERAHLLKICEKFRRGLDAISGMRSLSDSAIIPLITGDANKAVELSRKLESNGIRALAIRRPTVAAGSERIRFSIHASLSEADITEILTGVSQAYED